MIKKMLSAICILGVLGILIGLPYIFNQHNHSVKAAEEKYANEKVEPFADFGFTESLHVLPLVNWHSNKEGLMTEQGVSYLIKTDSNTILFDVGHNKEASDPSPLEHNLMQLGIALDEIDTVFISHNHPDHVGGRKWMKQASFSLGNSQVDLSNKKIFTPLAMNYPGAKTHPIPDPTIIAQGVATTGTITRKLFIGAIDEQVLAVNVADKGIVLIVGCGHQTTSKTIERAQRLFSQPIYGIIGDLHYPVPDGRINIGRINAQRTLASGNGPLDPLRQEEIHSDIELLKSLNLGIMALGGHDSSDQVIHTFSQQFESSYQYVNVGDWIHVAQGQHFTQAEF